MQSVFITGIGTNVGKTVTSAVLSQAWGTCYWKPIQAGDLEQSDTNKVQSWVSNPVCTFADEVYRLQSPMSPHAAAAIDNIEIESDTIIQRFDHLQTAHPHQSILIEGAGGLMVPLHQHYLMIDLIKDLSVPVIWVVNTYLGSINHSLMTYETLRQHGVEQLGIVFCGEINTQTKDYILTYTKLPTILHIPATDTITPQFISQTAKTCRFVL